MATNTTEEETLKKIVSEMVVKVRLQIVGIEWPDNIVEDEEPMSGERCSAVSEEGFPCDYLEGHTSRHCCAWAGPVWGRGEEEFDEQCESVLQDSQCTFLKGHTTVHHNAITNVVWIDQMQDGPRRCSAKNKGLQCWLESEHDGEHHIKNLGIIWSDPDPSTPGYALVEDNSPAALAVESFAINEDHVMCSAMPTVEKICRSHYSGRRCQLPLGHDGEFTMHIHYLSSSRTHLKWKTSEEDAILGQPTENIDIAEDEIAVLPEVVFTQGPILGQIQHIDQTIKVDFGKAEPHPRRCGAVSGSEDQFNRCDRADGHGGKCADSLTHVVWESQSGMDHEHKTNTEESDTTGSAD